MAEHETSTQLAICIQSSDPDLLTPRRIYEVLPDESAARSNYLRVIDNEGEDYLYPTGNFVLVSFAPEIERELRIHLKGGKGTSGYHYTFWLACRAGCIDVNERRIAA